MSLPTVCSKCRVRPVGPDQSVCEVCCPPARPDPGHQWASDKPQTRCVLCGAYKHLGSGFMPCRPPAVEAPAEPWFTRVN